jgi:glycosyltransferase involved in cell wall biosynthesis
MRVLVLSTHDAGLIDQQLAALEDRGIDSEQLIVPGDARSDSGHSPVDYLRFLPQVVRRSLDPFDLVYANYGLTGPIALAQPRLPVVLSLWGSDLYGSAGWISRFCARHSEEVVVMSERMGRDLGQDHTVVPHGVDLEKFAPEPQATARAEIGWDEDEAIVLFPYSPSRAVKDYPRAERIVDRVRYRVDAPVVLETVSGVPHEAVSTYMNAADALLLTSKHEGSPNTVKEALACNTPVVATDTGDVRQRVEGVEGSTVSDHDDELATGLAAALEREDRPETRPAVRDVSVERTAATLEEVFRRAATSRSSSLVEPTVAEHGSEHS